MVIGLKMVLFWTATFPLQGGYFVLALPVPIHEVWYAAVQIPIMVRQKKPSIASWSLTPKQWKTDWIGLSLAAFPQGIRYRPHPEFQISFFSLHTHSQTFNHISTADSVTGNQSNSYSAHAAHHSQSKLSSNSSQILDESTASSSNRK